MKRCVRCGNKISWEMPFCPLCGGRSLANEPDPEPARDLAIKPTASIVPQPPQQESAPLVPSALSVAETGKPPAKPPVDDAAARVSFVPEPEPARPKKPAEPDVSSEPFVMPFVGSPRPETIEMPPGEEISGTIEEPLIEPRRQPVVIDPKPLNTPEGGVFERSGAPVVIRTSPARADEISSSAFMKLEQPAKFSPPKEGDEVTTLYQSAKFSPPKEEDEAATPVSGEQKPADAPAEEPGRHKTKKPDMPIGEFLRMYPNASPGESEL